MVCSICKSNNLEILAECCRDSIRWTRTCMDCGWRKIDITILGSSHAGWHSRAQAELMAEEDWALFDALDKAAEDIANEVP